jgi:hypothetical protein
LTRVNFSDSSPISSHSGPSNFKKGKRTSENLNPDVEYIYIPSENESISDELEELEYSDIEVVEPPSKKQRYSSKKNSTKKTKKVKRRAKAIAKKRASVIVQQEQDDGNNKESKSSVVQSAIPESEIPKGGSFVWRYFRRSENSITSKCAVIMPDGKECVVPYNDGSTTSNLIGHLARVHQIFKPIEQNKVFILSLNLN